jgi:hypothetical protein
MDDRRVTLLAWGRVGVGASLLVAPRRAARTWIGEAADVPGVTAVVRALGVRDVAIGAGTLAAGNGRRAPSAWLVAGAIADAGDALATLLAYRHLPRVSRFPIVASAALTAGLELALLVSKSRPRLRVVRQSA